jgi:putative SOS response-associated peptidase YedK
MIIPMDGFYEWKQGSDGAAVTKAGKPVKQPFFIHGANGEPLAAAGLWAPWRDRSAGDAPWLHSCSVVTTEANQLMSSIHNRMPVFLPKSAWSAWLDPANQDVEALRRLLVPAPEDLLTMHPVSTAVNNVRNRGAELLDEVQPGDTEEVAAAAAQLPLQ